MRKILKICILICLITCLIGCSKKDSTFSITFIDVGHGDSALVECDGEYMLIDAGTMKGAEKVDDLLSQKNVSHIKHLVISHLHEDHMNGFRVVVKDKISVDNVLCNSDAIFNNEKFINDLNIQNDKYIIPDSNDSYKLGSADVMVVWNGDLNDNDSLVLLVKYGKTSFLFTGDINYKVEEEICNNNPDIFPVTLLKIAHHGSGTSSSEEFIKIVKPQFAVISETMDNMNRYIDSKDILKKQNVETYVTGENGNIVIESDGKTVKVVSPS